MDLKKHLNAVSEILTSHDVPISFLFGAGTSCSVQIPDPKTPGEMLPLIPAVNALTLGCRDEVKKIGAEFDKAWGELETETKTLLNRTDIEAILSRIRQKRDAILSDTIHGLTRDQLETFEKDVCRYIAETVYTPEKDIPGMVPHDKFASWIKSLTRTTRSPLEIFTTNYDILIERSLEAKRVPHFDGFVGSYRPYFDASVFDRDNAEIAPSWVRLWKIHGSINWHVLGREIYRGEANNSGEMILPSHYKYDESRKMPYRAMQDRLGRILSTPRSILITSGYSFNDEHINETIISNIDRSNASLYVFCYSDLDTDCPLEKIAVDRQNVTVLTPTGCICKGQKHEWSKASLEECEKDALLKSVVNGLKLKIGDFGSFCDLLEDLTK